MEWFSACYYYKGYSYKKASICESKYEWDAPKMGSVPKFVSFIKQFKTELHIKLFKKWNNFCRGTLKSIKIVTWMYEDKRFQLKEKNINI